MKTTTALMAPLIVLAACTSESNPQRNLPATQAAYIRDVATQAERVEAAKTSKNELQREAAEKEAAEIVKTPPAAVQDWVATVRSVSNNGGTILISAEQPPIDFTLRLVDPSLSSWAAGLTENKQIVFSGPIGTERSVTLSGALRKPEFRFIPTSIRTTSEQAEHVQSPEAIAAAMKADAEAELQTKLMDTIDRLCTKAVRQAAFNKKSVDLSFLNRTIAPIGKDTWRYRNEVTGQNAFGATVTHSVVCLVKTRINQEGTLQAAVVDLQLVD